MAPPVVQVDPQGFTKAADVYEGVHNALTTRVGTLTKILGECGGSAGSDNAGRKWSNDYDPAAWDTVDALGDLALAVGQMHDLLQFTAANHANANSQSAPEPNPSDVVFPPGTLKVYQPPEPPAAYGGHDAEPTGWNWIKGYVEGEIWPNGHPDVLRKAAAAWRTMANDLGIAAAPLPNARELIEAQQSTETSQALEQADIVKGQFDSLAGVCESLATSCDSYADSVEQTKDAIKRALIELAALVALDQTFGWIAAPFTGGGSAAAAQGGMALAISVYGARIATTIRALVGLVEIVRVPAAVSQAIARGSEALIPLLRAQPALAGVDGAVAPGAFTSWSKLRRPNLTQAAKDKIVASTKTWRRPGTTGEDDFYIVKSETEVKVPINKSYDDKPWVTQLDKTPDGKYYIDSANNSLYPVNPKWEYGHNSGFENRKLLADAQTNNLTQKELDDLVNSHPDWFHVEDMTGNRSHRREGN
ncbi:HNH/ENDO VII family nuclease [Nocardia sp. NBC_01730]|uniref:WXG100-like domain-containing protein n=1 Tax=Nocardia sp. NBC_01730 TaxID=2975998 RepID=UPI002E15F0C3|nr:HNH/ENDO VII family nuclease [Nocardia sp. NBC_01730]